MRLILQRVAAAAVSVDGETVGAIGPGLLVLAGLRVLHGAPGRGATFVSIGAVLGALPIFWALLPLLLALALLVLSVLYARRAARSPRAAV